MKQKTEQVKAYVPEGTGEMLDDVVEKKGFKSRSRLIAFLISEYLRSLFGDKDE